jgi:multisubunit Na+/H+ antiporter MnhE subunit
MAGPTVVDPGVTRASHAPDDAGRNESRQEREDRNLIELLQELRVAGLGVQVLFGFLLSLPFTNHFDRLDPDQRHVYMATLLLAALSTALLTAPVAVHRLVFRKHRTEHLVRAANAMALSGLAAVGLSVTGAVWLVSSVVTPGVASALVAGTAATFTLLWLVVPVVGRLRWAPDPTGGTGHEHQHR